MSANSRRDRDSQARKASFIDRIRKVHHGFLSESLLATLAEVDRFHPVLVRCGGCRFTAPAQNVAHLIDIITDDGRDYVRDVSLPATR